MTGVTYVITHSGYRSVKVGFADIKSDRLEQFGRRGWQVFRRLFLATPRMARDVEQATLFELRHHLYVPRHLAAVDMPLMGATETSCLALIDAHDVWEVVCEQAGLLQMSPIVKSPDGRRNNGGSPPRRVPGVTQPYSRIARKQAALERAATKPASDTREEDSK